MADIINFLMTLFTFALVVADVVSIASREKEKKL